MVGVRTATARAVRVRAVQVPPVPARRVRAPAARIRPAALCPASPPAAVRWPHGSPGHSSEDFDSGDANENRQTWHGRESALTSTKLTTTAGVSWLMPPSRHAKTFAEADDLLMQRPAWRSEEHTSELQSPY